MKRAIKVFKYLLSDSIRPAAIFYLVIVLLTVIGATFTLTMNNWNFEFGGMRLATTIFLFVAGLNSFKSGYLFLQANGVTRRTFYAGGLVSIMALAAAMTVIDSILYAVLNIIVPVSQELSPLLYPQSGYPATLVWTLAFNTLATVFGWVLTMVYYRSGKGLKIALSISPAILLIGLILVSDATGGKLLESLSNAFCAVMGLTGTRSAWVGAGSMFVAAALCAGLSFLLIRRAPVKEQDK